MQSTDSDLDSQLRHLLDEHAGKQGELEKLLRDNALDRTHLQVYIERAKANGMVRSIVTLTNYIDNQLDVGTVRQDRLGGASR